MWSSFTIKIIYASSGLIWVAMSLNRFNLLAELLQSRCLSVAQQQA